MRTTTDCFDAHDIIMAHIIGLENRSFSFLSYHSHSPSARIFLSLHERQQYRRRRDFAALPATRARISHIFFAAPGLVVLLLLTMMTSAWATRDDAIFA